MRDPNLRDPGDPPDPRPPIHEENHPREGCHKTELPPTPMSILSSPQRRRSPRAHLERVLLDLERFNAGELGLSDLEKYSDDDIAEARTWIAKQKQATLRAEIRRPLPG